jgi:glycosyltransferase involved in cell wall biosynthesis
MRRLILDISTIARWSGPPVGIVRVEHRLAQHVLRQWPEVVLAVYDARIRRLREVKPAWREKLAGLDAVIDTNTLDFRWRRPRLRRILSFRYPLLMALQRLHLSSPAVLRGAAAWLRQQLLGAHAALPPFTRPDGQQEVILPVKLVLGPALQLGPADTVLRAGSNWHDGAEIARAQQVLGFRLAVICYDLLPLTHPEFFPPAELPGFKAYWRSVLPAASRILCNANCIARDITAFAAEQRLSVHPPRIIPLGYSPPQFGKLPELQVPLRPKRFAMFVSTIEPRKGHAMLLQAWRLLLAENIPQWHDFHLVFVGRTGWMVEEILAELNGPAGNHLLHLRNIADDMLERLYRDAAFCLYPSQYEGFGLPIIEAFAHGKAVIASSGGAIPETAGGLSPCLPPGDTAAWAAMLAEWIANPAAYQPWEQKIANEFRYEPWPDAAEKILTAAFYTDRHRL